MAGLPGSEMDDYTRELIHHFRVNNFILFKRNLSKGPEPAFLLTSEIRQACLEAGLSPPLIAVDQEGGPVQRLAPPFWTKMVSNQEVGLAKMPEEAVVEQAKTAAELLNEVGININLAPVLDLALSGQNKVMAERCYSCDISLTASLGMLYITTLQSYSIAATAKHFPGIGRIQQDPHFKRPSISADAETILSEAQPFQQAIEAGVMAIMTSHILFPAFDNKNIATFSNAIANQLLRSKFGFKGVLMTDDLEMGGIVEHNFVPEAAVKALKAGHDMLLICHDQELVKESIMTIEKAVANGTLSMKRLKESSNRINKLRFFVERGGTT